MEPCVGRVGDRHVAVAGEVGLERDVLTANLRLRRRHQRSSIRVTIRFVERHAAVAVAVGSAAQAHDEVVREVARVKLVGLLRELLRRARCHDGDALGREARNGVERKVRRGLGALRTRELSRLTRVEHDQRERARQLAKLFTQRRDRKLLASEAERVGLRVARVIEDEHGLLALGAMRAELGRDLFDRAQHRRAVGSKEHAHVGRSITPELLEHLRHAACVVFRIAELGLAGTARVRADENAIRERVGDARDRCGRAVGRQLSGRRGSGRGYGYGREYGRARLSASERRREEQRAKCRARERP